MLPLGLVPVEQGGITPLPAWPAAMTPKRKTHATAHIHAPPFASIERNLELPL
jgi:hypothetical protein